MSEVEDDLAPLDGQPEGEGELMVAEALDETSHALLPANPMEMVARALEKGIDGPMLQQFMDLQERYEANEARKAYAADMAKCQKAMEPIVAAAENDHTTSYYAKLGTINKQITPIYGKHGFSISFGHGKAEAEGDIRTTAVVLHKLGHREDFFVDFPPDDVGSAGNTNKTAIHARKSSNTYGKRTIIEGIFNLSILSEDDDGNAAGGVGAGKVDDEQTMRLNAMITEWEISDATPIMREFGIDDWAKLPAKKFEKAVQRINVIGEARSKSR